MDKRTEALQYVLDQQRSIYKLTPLLVLKCLSKGQLEKDDTKAENKRKLSILEHEHTRKLSILEHEQTKDRIEFERRLEQTIRNEDRATSVNRVLKNPDN